MTPIRSILAITAVALGMGAAQAHNVWLVPDAQGAYLVQFGGHEGKLESFDSSKLKAVTAYDRRGRKIDVATQAATDGVRVKPAREPASNGTQMRIARGSRAPSGSTPRTGRCGPIVDRIPQEWSRAPYQRSTVTSSPSSPIIRR